ncbi:MAG TPA: AgmX/PglI C-terminal domain-containing protein [Kofleriaceae bacterium]
MRTFIASWAVSLVACSSPTPKAKVDPAKGSATTTSAATLTPGAELPEVALSGFDAADNATPSVSATLSGITVDGMPVAALQDGVVRGDELDGGALGLLITRLAVVADRLDRTKPVLLGFDRRIPYRTLIATLFTLKKSGHAKFGLLARAGAHVVMAPITLPDHVRTETATGGDFVRRAPDPATSPPSSILAVIQAKYLAGIKRCYKDHLKRDPKAQGKIVLTFTIDNTGKTKDAKATGIAPGLDACITKLMASWTFAPSEDPEGEMIAINLVLVPDGGTTVQPPAKLSSGAPTAAPPVPHSPPLKMIVSVTKTDVRLWSLSGLEGTLDAPKFAAKLAETSALADLNRKLAEIVANRFPAAREAGDREILIQSDPAIPMQTIAEVIGALRATPEAKELFPDVVFSTGFE